MKREAVEGPSSSRTIIKDAAEQCFVIMPISDPPDYESGHFRRVYEDLFEPACRNAGYHSIRADDVRETNLIHVDILKRLLESPMAICDLSTQNPNVLFELGFRQAFDKPVLLVLEQGSKSPFDIVMRDVVSEIDLSSFAVLALSPRLMREAHAIPC